MIDQKDIKTEEQRRAYDTIVLKKQSTEYGSSEFLSKEEKQAYSDLLEEMRSTKDLAKVMVNSQFIPWDQVSAFIHFRELQTLEEILKVLKERGCSCGGQ